MSNEVSHKNRPLIGLFPGCHMWAWQAVSSPHVASWRRLLLRQGLPSSKKHQGGGFQPDKNILHSVFLRICAMEPLCMVKRCGWTHCESCHLAEKRDFQSAVRYVVITHSKTRLCQSVRMVATYVESYPLLGTACLLCACLYLGHARYMPSLWSEILPDVYAHCIGATKLEI